MAAGRTEQVVVIQKYITLMGHKSNRHTNVMKAGLTTHTYLNITTGVEDLRAPISNSFKVRITNYIENYDMCQVFRTA